MNKEEYIKAFGRSPRILVVEDNENLIRLYTQSLERAGFEVTGIGDGKLLEEKLKQQEFDVVLCDTYLPLNGGWGPRICEAALTKGILKDNTLLLAMSLDPENEDCWGNIMHNLGFFDKSSKQDIGDYTISHLYNFKFSKSPTWRLRAYL